MHKSTYLYAIGQIKDVFFFKKNANMHNGMRIFATI